MAASPSSKRIIAQLRTGARFDLLILAIPSHDRENRPLNNQELWAEQGLELFSELYGGATAFKTFRGVFRSESGKDLWDNPILIESYVERARVEDPDRLRSLLGFIRRMKAATRQEAIMLVVNDYRWFL